MGAVNLIQRSTFMTISLFTSFIAFGQIQWNVNAGAGVSYYELFNSNDVYNFHYTGGPVFQVGSSISSSFGKDAISGWEVGLNIISGGYYSVPPFENGRGWDYSNKKSIRDWYIQLPLSLSFDFFEGTGFLVGGRMNYRLETPKDLYLEYRKWIPAGHIGIFTRITPRIRLDVTGFIDIPPRVTLIDNRMSGSSESRRDVGATLNIRYTIN